MPLCTIRTNYRRLGESTKKLNGLKCFINSIYNHEEMITYFKGKNRKRKRDKNVMKIYFI